MRTQRRRQSWISALEAMHAPVDDTRRWVEAIAGELADAIGVDRAFVGFNEVSHSAACRDLKMTTAIGSEIFFAAGAQSMIEAFDERTFRELYYPPRMVLTLASACARLGGTSPKVLREHLRANTPGVDMLGVVLHPEPGVAAVLFTLLTAESQVTSDTRRFLTKFGLHLETHLRARRRPEEVCAIITPAGKVEHLAAERAPPAATIAEHVGRIERARTSRTRREPEALDMWPALVGGRLSLIERFDGGRRYYYAVENAPPSQPIRALTADEIAAISYATRGMSLKTIGYALGVPDTAISSRLASAASKIGVATTLELVRIAAMFANDPRARFAKTALTASEQDVLDLLQQGLSNRQIAALRQRSVRTIANQVSALLRKTGKRSRRELVVTRP